MQGVPNHQPDQVSAPRAAMDAPLTSRRSAFDPSSPAESLGTSWAARHQPSGVKRTTSASPNLAESLGDVAVGKTEEGCDMVRYGAIC